MIRFPNVRLVQRQRSIQLAKDRRLNKRKKQVNSFHPAVENE